MSLVKEMLLEIAQHGYDALNCTIRPHSHSTKAISWTNTGSESLVLAKLPCYQRTSLKF